MYIPNLPEHMLDVAEEAFMPYMIGLHSKHLGKVSFAGRVVIYVDQNRIEYN